MYRLLVSRERPDEMTQVPEYTINVPISGREYGITVGDGIVAETSGKSVADVVAGRSCMIVSDSNVLPLYGDAAERLLLEGGASAVA